MHVVDREEELVLKVRCYHSSSSQRRLCSTIYVVLFNWFKTKLLKIAPFKNAAAPPLLDYNSGKWELVKSNKRIILLSLFCIYSDSEEKGKITEKSYPF